MEASSGTGALWKKLPLLLRAIISGLLIGMIAANVWPLLLLRLGVPVAAPAEALFLALYLWWAAGGGPPKAARAARAECFRSRRLSRRQWFWAILAALVFAVAVNASLVFLFRLVLFPAAAFHKGYDFSFIPAPALRWIAVVMSAASAGICEETGFRGYMQRPLEKPYGVGSAILISSVFFTLIHLTKAWALLGMIPIVFGAGLLLGLLARTSASLIPCIIGHTLMDIGLFAYWWTGIAGTFTARPITETGPDRAFAVTCVVLAVSIAVLWLSFSNLRRAAPRTSTAEPSLTAR